MFSNFPENLNSTWDLEAEIFDLKLLFSDQLYTDPYFKRSTYMICYILKTILTIFFKKKSEISNDLFRTI